jgi:hypothetical protein
VSGVVSRLTAIVRGVSKTQANLLGVAVLVVLVGGIAASVTASHGVQEQHRRQLLAEVMTSAAAFEAEAATISAAGAEYEVDASAATELAGELTAMLGLPPEPFDPAARAGVERALAQLEDASSPLPEPKATIIAVREDATVDELRSTEQDVIDAAGELEDRAEEVETRRSELGDAMDAARSAATTLIDGVIGGTEGLLAANAAASAESSDRVRTIVAALGVTWTADSLREWVDAVTALEASSAEAAARLDVDVDAGGVDAGQSTATTPEPGWAPPTWPTDTVPSMSGPPPPPPPSPEPTPVDTWPVIWNEHWRPFSDCVGNMGLVNAFPATDYGNGLDSGMSTPWTHSWGTEGVFIYSCGS